jgi:hypothetical protein
MDYRFQPYGKVYDAYSQSAPTVGQSECDFNYLRHVGYSEHPTGFYKFFSKDTVALISKKITQLTKGVDKLNRDIIVPDQRICEVMDGVYQQFRPSTGDIYTRYVIDSEEQNSMTQNLIDQTIEVIFSNIVNQLGIEEANSKLSAWVQVYGDFNVEGLRAHSEIKIREKRPISMEFHMRY